MKSKKFEIEVLGNVYPGELITEEKRASVKLARFFKNSNGLCGIDTETRPKPEYRSYPGAALSPHLSNVRLIQIFNGKEFVVFDLENISESIFVPYLEKHRFIGHYAIFDLKRFMQMGVKNMKIGCTLILARLLTHATRPTDLGLSLDDLVTNILGVKNTKKVGNTDWGNKDLTFEQIEYAALDPIYTYLLAEKLAPSLQKYGLERIYTLHKDAQHPIAHMELNGLSLDIEAHKENISKWREEAYHAKEDVLSYTGLKKLTGSTLAGWLEENLDEEDLNAWPRTEKGKLKTDAHVFSDFNHLEIAAKYEKYQKLSKLIDGFGDNLLRLINPETRRLHASYTIGGARTGRMACSRPNLQQLPRDKAVRNIFIPSKSKHCFVCADFSQIELRVAAEISGDKTMRKAYMEGIDLHSLTASKILNKSLDKVTKEDRQIAKAFNFGLLFGLGSAKFSHYARMSYKVEVSEEEAIKAIDIFRTTYSGYREWQLEQASRCEGSLLATTVCGKRRRLLAESYYGSGLNQPIQGTAAEILLYALIKFQRACDRHEWKLVNTVHDEITVECKKSQALVCKGALEASMEAAYFDVFPNSKLTKGLVEAKVGNSWGEAK